MRLVQWIVAVAVAVVVVGALSAYGDMRGRSVRRGTAGTIAKALAEAREGSEPDMGRRDPALRKKLATWRLSLSCKGEKSFAEQIAQELKNSLAKELSTEDVALVSSRKSDLRLRIRLKVQPGKDRQRFLVVQMRVRCEDRKQISHGGTLTYELPETADEQALALEQISNRVILDVTSWCETVLKGIQSRELKLLAVVLPLHGMSIRHLSPMRQQLIRQELPKILTPISASELERGLRDMKGVVDVEFVRENDSKTLRCRLYRLLWDRRYDRGGTSFPEQVFQAVNRFPADY